MRLTENRIRAILQRQDQLLDLAKDFAYEKKGSGRDIQFEYWSNKITWDVNTSCHCHPKYGRVTVGTVNEFIEWLNKKGY